VGVSILWLPAERGLIAGFYQKTLGFKALLEARGHSSERCISSDTVFSLCAVKSDVIQNEPLSASLCEDAWHCA
jgi:hypothetical protein